MSTTDAPAILVTGAAGFIGMHVAARLIGDGRRVVGVDNLNTYYDPTLKTARLAELGASPLFEFQMIELADRDATARLIDAVRPKTVIHLAAQAGVRYSLVNPAAYIDSNLVAFGNILEACRNGGVGHLVYASSSSVYGTNAKMPFATSDPVDHPVSLYAATKKANELMAHTYSHLFSLPTTGLRFFTVYGPWGRPDMAPMLFTKAILEGRPIEVFNEGRMLRDFTYIDDIVEGVVRIADRPAAPAADYDAMHPDPARSWAPFRLYNIGNNEPVELNTFITTLEGVLGRHAERILKPMQPGDVPATYADVTDLARDAGFRPSTTLADGLARFVSWYRRYYGL